MIKNEVSKSRKVLEPLITVAENFQYFDYLGLIPSCKGQNIISNFDLEIIKN